MRVCFKFLIPLILIFSFFFVVFTNFLLIYVRANRPVFQLPTPKLRVKSGSGTDNKSKKAIESDQLFCEGYLLKKDVVLDHKGVETFEFSERYFVLYGSNLFMYTSQQV